MFYGNAATPANLQTYDLALKRVSAVHTSVNRNYVSSTFRNHHGIFEITYKFCVGFYKVKKVVFSSTGNEIVTYEQLVIFNCNK